MPFHITAYFLQDVSKFAPIELTKTLKRGVLGFFLQSLTLLHWQAVSFFIVALPRDSAKTSNVI